MLIANIVGIFIFFYLYWRRLKEDYLSEKIFNASFILFGSVVIGFLLSRYLMPDYWFWILLLVLAITQVIIVFKIKFKFFESLDALIVSLLPWLSLFFLAKSISTSSLSSFLVFWVGLTSVFLFFLFDNFYRTFPWYKSGRVGFSGLATLGIFFIVRIFLITPSFEKILSGTVAFLSFLLLFRLAKNYE